MSGKYCKHFLFIFVLLFMPFSLFAETKYEKATFRGRLFLVYGTPFRKTGRAFPRFYPVIQEGVRRIRRIKRFRQEQPFILNRSR